MLDSALGANANRIKDTANVTLSLGGELSLTGGTTSLTETVANLKIIGNSTLTVKQGTAGAVATMAGASFTRTAKATALVRGTALGQNITQMGKLTFADPGGLSFVGTSVLNNSANSDATKTVRIIPYFLGGSTDMEAGSTFVTYDTTLGLRALNTTNQFTTLAATYATPGTRENVKGFSGTITAASPSINSLLFSSANQTLAGSGTLTIDSGTIASVANNEIISGFSGVTLGNGTWNEGVIHVAGSQLTINPPVTVTGGGGLTKGGSSLLLLAAPVYAGDTTVNAGTLQINAINPNDEASSVAIMTGAKMQLNFTGNDTIHKLYIGGTRMPNGTYGRTTTGATNGGLGVGALDAYFGTTGSGKLTVLDNVAPTLAPGDIVDDKGGAPVTANTLVTYTVTFSEEMDASTVTATDFGNAGTSAINIGSVTQTSPGVFTVQVTPTTTGTLQLEVIAGADLRDFVGIALITTSAILDDTTITVNSAGSPYLTWSGGAAANADTNGDSVSNGVAWVLGSANPSANATGKLPVASQNRGDLGFNFTCLKVAQSRRPSVLKLQYSTDIGVLDFGPPTKTPVPDTDGTLGGVVFVTSANADPALVNVQATIPATAASPGGKLFGRLDASE